jgi:deoxyribose-phosphate aldolase
MATSEEGTPLARCIERALFAADATRGDIEKLCAEARRQAWFGVCVNGSRVELARTLLEESEVRVVALVGFPWGAATVDAKRYETEAAVDDGAHEVDAVINIGRLKEGDGRFVLRELRDIVEAAEERPVKAVLETHLLTREEIILGLELAMESGAQFVATSTDWHVPKVKVEDVALLREKAGAEFGIKAAGDIRDANFAQALIKAGATRIGVASDILSASGPA